MADRSATGKPLDHRTQQIKLRKIQHDIHALEVTIERTEIQVLEAEANIARYHEAIEATRAAIAAKQEELAKHQDPDGEDS